MFTILVVCSANVCRSPLAAFVLARAIGPDVGVISAGTRAREGQKVCAKVRANLERDEAGSRFALNHESRRVTADLIDVANLILVPDLANRSLVAQVTPLARHRSFTFREAQVLLDLIPDGDLAPVDLSGAMNARRASATGIREEGHLFPRRQEPDLNIVDGHMLGFRQHRRTIRDTQSAASAVALGLQRTASVEL